MRKIEEELMTELEKAHKAGTKATTIGKSQYQRVLGKKWDASTYFDKIRRRLLQKYNILENFLFI